MKSVNSAEITEEKESETHEVYSGDVEYSMSASPLAHEDSNMDKLETSDKDNSASETSSLRTTPEKKSETSESKEPTSPSEENSVNDISGTIDTIAQPPKKTPEVTKPIGTVDLDEVKTLTQELLDHERLHSESRESIVQELAELSLVVNEEEMEVQKQNLKNKQNSEVENTPALVEHMNGLSDVLENKPANSHMNGTQDDEQDGNETMECDRGEGDGANELDDILEDNVLKTDNDAQVEDHEIRVDNASKDKSEDQIEVEDVLDNKPETIDSTNIDNRTIERSDSKEAPTPPESEKSCPKSEPLSRTCSEDKEKMLSDLESIRSVAGSDSEKSVPSTNVPSVDNSPLHKLSSLESSPMHKVSSVESSPQHKSDHESKKSDSPKEERNSKESSPKYTAKASSDTPVETTPSSSSPVPVHRSPSTINSTKRSRSLHEIPTSPEPMQSSEDKLPTSESDASAEDNNNSHVENENNSTDVVHDTENIDSINNNPENVYNYTESINSTNSMSINEETITNINKNPDNINNNQAPRPGNAVRDTTTTSTQVLLTFILLVITLIIVSFY